jgi:hypothetical protein
MQYKTIVLELIQENSGLYEELRSSKRLLPAIDAYSIELRTSHHIWMEAMALQRPGGDPSQVSSEALELAIHDLTGHLPFASPVAGANPVSLDGAMNFLRKHSPTA